MSDKSDYDPLKFLNNAGLMTAAIAVSFFSVKFLNSLYENIYEPTMDVVINSGGADKYYLKIGKYYIQGDAIIKDFIKWFILIMIIMILYNLFIKRKTSQ